MCLLTDKVDKTVIEEGDKLKVRTGCTKATTTSTSAKITTMATTKIFFKATIIKTIRIQTTHKEARTRRTVRLTWTTRSGNSSAYT